MQNDHFVSKSLYSINPDGPPGERPRGWTWDALMEIALDQAKKAAFLGEVPVGALLIENNGLILAKTGNRVENSSDPLAHAEILALRKGARAIGHKKLTNAILIVTLEPCLMCVSAIAQSRIAGVVFGAADARAGCLVSAAFPDTLPLSGRSFWHLGGIRSQECISLLQEFFRKRRSSPYISC